VRPWRRTSRTGKPMAVIKPTSVARVVAFSGTRPPLARRRCVADQRQNVVGRRIGGCERSWIGSFAVCHQIDL
jgi:hypothetical protein